MSEFINNVPRELLERACEEIESMYEPLDEKPVADSLRALLSEQPQAKPDKWDQAMEQARRLNGVVLSQASSSVIIPVAQIERAARKLAECMDYPWEHMPDQGRCTMMLHAEAILEAARKQGF